MQRGRAGAAAAVVGGEDVGAETGVADEGAISLDAQGQGAVGLADGFVGEQGGLKTGFKRGALRVGSG